MAEGKPETIMDVARLERDSRVDSHGPLAERLSRHFQFIGKTATGSVAPVPKELEPELE